MEVSASEPRIVSMDQVRAELERLGFTILPQAGSEVIAVRKKRHPWNGFSSDMTYVVFVQSTSSLTITQIDLDRERLVGEASQLTSSRVPRRLRRIVVVVPVYLARTVDPGARVRCEAGDPQSGLPLHGHVYFPAARDETTGEPFFCRDREKPLLYLPKLQFLMERLLDPEHAPEREPGVGSTLRAAFRTPGSWYDSNTYS